MGPGGKQPIMKDTMWNGQIQKMVDTAGIPKGMKIVLQERGVNTHGLKAEKMREILSGHPDFLNVKTLVEEMVEGSGHLCLFFPKFHCDTTLLVSCKEI